MNYTIKEVCKMMGFTEHAVRYYTNMGLMPCERDGANRRIFNDESINWLQGIKCLKGCGLSIEEIKQYSDLCLREESRENLEARYRIFCDAREKSYRALEEAQAQVAYMDAKVKHYEDILAGLIPDDSNPNKWDAETKPTSHR